MSGELAWLNALLEIPSRRWARNVETTFTRVEVGGHAWPVTVNDVELENSYVCSPYTAFIGYAREELAKIPVAPLRFALGAMIWLFDGVLRRGDINRTVSVNNWLLSTNLYAEGNEAFDEDLLRRLIARYPRHSIVLRSLNALTNGVLMERCRAAGGSLMPTRQVYIFDRRRQDYLRKTNTKRDFKFLGDGKFRVVAQDELLGSDFERLEVLYNELYLDKYSHHNPQFTAEFLEMCARTRAMTIVALRDPVGRLQGFIGYFIRNGVMTTPLVGYNLKLPQDLALYRRLIALALREAAALDVVLNMSSGAADFKRVRGGIPVIEYCAVFRRHLPWRRQIVLAALELILKCVGVPILKLFKL